MRELKKFKASMVDISEKKDVHREAIAKGFIKLKPETIQLIKEKKIKKGDPFNIATIAGILAAKKTNDMIPMCHPIPLTNVSINIEVINESYIEVTSKVKANAKTGVEMEALSSVSITLLNIWDMVKSYEKDEDGQYPHTSIKEIRILEKRKTEK
jgi:cyclic pyranopterin phosphate synthase